MCSLSVEWTKKKGPAGGRSIGGAGGGFYLDLYMFSSVNTDLSGRRGNREQGTGNRNGGFRARLFLFPVLWACRPHLAKNSPQECFPGARCPCSLCTTLCFSTNSSINQNLPMSEQLPGFQRLPWGRLIKPWCSRRSFWRSISAFRCFISPSADDSS